MFHITDLLVCICVYGLFESYGKSSYIDKSRMGVNKSSFVSFSVSKMFVLVKFRFRFFKPHPCLAKQINIKYLDIQYLMCVLTMLKKLETHRTQDMGLVTPTHMDMPLHWHIVPYVGIYSTNSELFPVLTEIDATNGEAALIQCRPD